MILQLRTGAKELVKLIKKIISGGQTGADLAALDSALANDIAHGGAVPAGRKTENGPLPAQYKMEELASPRYADRTEKNVQDGDGTLIVSHGALTGGSALTLRIAQSLGKPCLHLDLSKLSIDQALERVSLWVVNNQIGVLNVAGPRASSDPQIYQQVRRLLDCLLSPSEGVGYGFT